ncbi:MAG: hypothetical protein AAB421_05300 [Patescibacteria group bacterium]
MANFINLTPHPVRLRPNAANTAASPDATDIVVAPFAGPDGKPAPARVSSTPGGVVGEAAGLPIYGAPMWGAVEGLPAPVEGTIFIVSLLVLGHLSGRDDVVGPGTGPADNTVRYSEPPERKGQVYAVTRLNRG